MLVAISDGVWIAGLGGFFTLAAGVVAAIAHYYTARASADVERNTLAMQQSQLRVDEWDKLLKAKDAENARLNQRITELEKEAERGD